MMSGVTFDSVLVFVSVAISSLILAVGLWLLGGWYLADFWPANIRYAAGTVMALYGIYRIVTARKRLRALGDRDRFERQDDEDDRDV